MLQWIREKKRIAQIILALLILPFACTGIEQFRLNNNDENVLAKVAGQPLTKAEFDQALRSRLDQLRSMMGSSVDVSKFDTPTARQALLQQLITERAVMAAAQKNNLNVSDEQLAAFITSLPIFQENNQFSRERYQQFLTKNQYTEAEFDNMLRRDLMLKKLVDLPGSTEAFPHTLTGRFYQALEEQRVVQSKIFDPNNFLASNLPSQQQIADYYAKNTALYESHEQADVEYLVLSAETLGQNLSISKQEVENFYKANQARYQTPEQRRASHILISFGDDKNKAKAKAAEVLAKVRQAPDSFATLAQQFSDDPGSKEKGGDLDFFGRGAMVPAFETTVFKLKKNEISDIVESDYGFHIIRLTDIRAGSNRPLNEVQSEIEKELRQQQASKRYAEAASQFTDVVYEQSDSLQPAAEKLGLAVQKFNGLSRTENPLAHPLLSNAKVREAIFSDDVLRNKRNTQALEIGTNTLVAARVSAYRPRAVRPLNEVRDDVAKRVQTELALKQARETGEAALKALQQGAKPEGFSADLNVSRQNPNNLSPEALRAVMKVDRQKFPSVVGVDLGSRGYALYRVTAVKAVEAVADAEIRQQQLQQQLAQVIAEAEETAMAESLKTAVGIKVIHNFENTDAAKKPSAVAEKAQP